MDSQPSSSSGRPQRKRKPNTKFDIEDTISIPVKSQRKKKSSQSQPAQSASQSASQSVPKSASQLRKDRKDPSSTTSQSSTFWQKSSKSCVRSGFKTEIHHAIILHAQKTHMVKRPHEFL